MDQFSTSRRTLLKQAGVAGAALTATGLPLAAIPLQASAQSSEVNFYCRGDEAIFKVFDQLKAKFEEQEPDIKINIEQAPGEDQYDKFLLKIASGDPPDCLFECDCTITSSIRANALAPLDDLIANDTRFNKADYLDISWYTSEFDGKTYGLPYDGGSMVYFYNKDLFAAEGVELPDPKTPITWDKLIEIGQKLTKDRGGKHPGEDGFDANRITQYGLSPSTWMPWVWVWGNGGEVITGDGKVALAEPAAAEGLQFLADLINVHHIAPTPETSEGQTISFLTGNVAIQYDGVWSMVRYQELEFDWDVAPFPMGKVQASTGWYSPLAITSSAKNPDGAWKWISFCCSEVGQTIVAQLGQAVPPLSKLANSEAFLNPNTKPVNKQVFLDQLDSAILRTPGDTFGKYFGGYRKEWGDIFSPAFDAVLRGDKTAAEVMAEVQPKLQNLLDTGQISWSGSDDCGCEVQ